MCWPEVIIVSALQTLHTQASCALALLVCTAKDAWAPSPVHVHGARPSGWLNTLQAWQGPPPPPPTHIFIQHLQHCSPQAKVCHALAQCMHVSVMRSVADTLAC